MRIVISQDNNKLYKSELLAFDPSMEIIALNPLDCYQSRLGNYPRIRCFIHVLSIFVCC